MLQDEYGVKEWLDIYYGRHLSPSRHRQNNTILSIFQKSTKVLKTGMCTFSNS